MYFLTDGPKNKNERLPEDDPTVENQKSVQNAFSDDEDLVLSQALDEIERSQVEVAEPEPKRPKIDVNKTTRFRLNLFKPQKSITIERREHENQLGVRASNDNTSETMSIDANESGASTARPEQKSNPNLKERPPVKFGLSRFAFVPWKNPNKENCLQPPSQGNAANAEKSGPSTSTQQSQLVSNPVKNRIFCTPSDDEISQASSSSNRLPLSKRPIKLNLFNRSLLSKVSQVSEQQNVVVTSKSNESKSENDSAYDTMSFSWSSSVSGRVSVAKTGRTPALFPPSDTINQNDNDDDLAILETVDF